MAIVTPALLSAINTAVRADFQTGQRMVEPQYQRIATVVPSTTASNTYGWLGQFPKLREWIGSRVLKDMAAHGYAIVNKLYEATVAIKRTDIEDDAIGVYKPLFQEAGRASEEYPDEHVFALLAAGLSTLCYDGQNFFDTDHPVYPNVDGTGVAATVSNYQAGASAAWYLLDTSRPIKPLIFQERSKPELQSMTRTDDESVFMQDEYRYGVRARSNVGFGFWQQAYCSKAALTPDNLNAAIAAMMSVQSDGGRPLGVRPTLLVVPPTLRAAALEAVKAERLANGATNVNRDAVDVLICPWLV